MHVRHAQGFGLGLHLALIVDVGLRQFVLEKSFVVVPGFCRRTVRQPRQIFLVLDGLSTLAATRGYFGEQREIQTLDRLAAFIRQLGADASFIFESGNLVASGAAVVTHPLLALGLQVGIVHERSVCI